MSNKIIPFEPQYADTFKTLNIAWLEHYFHVEPKDTFLLDHCEQAIIAPGGYIFFAAYQEHIVGCFSYIKSKNNDYELGKMAVDANYQGLKIGQHMLSFAIDFAKTKKWHKVTLYSSTKLDAALHIYKKYGFKEIPLEENLPYARSDIKMELNL